MTLVDSRSSSTKRTEHAPRLSASIPSAPLPAKRSRTRAPISRPQTGKDRRFYAIHSWPTRASNRQADAAGAAGDHSHARGMASWPSNASPRAQRRRRSGSGVTASVRFFVFCVALFSNAEQTMITCQVAPTHVHQICAGHHDAATLNPGK